MPLTGSRALSPAMYGREPQLDSLMEHLRLAESDGGRIVFISGEAGIGKTRLTEEMLQRISGTENVAALQGYCYDASPAIPYGPFLDALLQLIRREGAEAVAAAAGSWAGDLQPLLPDLSPYLTEPVAEVDPRIQKRRLFEALFHVLATDPADRPRIIVLEDLQWSDASSRELLPFICQRIDRRPLLLVGTYRSDELHRRHPFTKTVTSLAREGAFHEIRLEPLSRQAVENMLEAIIGQPLPDGFVQAFYTQTGGNPFFVEELLKSIFESGQLEAIIEAANKGRGLELLDIPTTLAASVLMRTDALAEDQQLTLRKAAVIGRRFGFEMLKRLTGLDEERLVDCLQDLMRIQLIEEAGGEGDQYQFRHALTREAVYDALVQRERRTIHRQVLGVLEDLHHADLDRAADRLAYHSLMARDLEKGRTYAEMAGREAARKLAHREAIAHLETALELTGEEQARERAELLHELGIAAYPIGDTRLYSRYWTEARATFRELGEERKAAQISLRLSRLAWERGDRTEAFARAHEALETFGEEDEGEDVAMAYSVLSQLHMLSSQVEEAVRWGERALAMAEAADSKFVRIHALNNLGGAHFEMADLETGISLLEESFRLGKESKAGFETVRAGNNLGEFLLATGQLDRSRRVMDEAMEVAERAGLRLHKSYLQANLGAIALEQGLWQEAEELLAHSLRSSELGLPILRLFAAPWMAELLRRRGELAAGLALLEKTMPIADKHGEYQFLRLLLPVLAQTNYDRGNLEALGKILDQCLELARAYPPAIAAAKLLMRTAELLILLGRAEEAAPLREAVDRLQVKAALWINEARLRHLDGVTHESERDWNTAAEAYRKAAGLWGDHGHPYQEAVDRRGLARSLAEAGALAEAGREERQARAILRELGAADDLASLAPPALGSQEEMDEGRIAGEVEALTPRESEVLQQLSKGMSNREIAEELVISIKTVEVHVSSILGKLGMSSRTEAVAYAAKRGWIGPEGDGKAPEHP